VAGRNVLPLRLLPRKVDVGAAFHRNDCKWISVSPQFQEHYKSPITDLGWHTESTTQLQEAVPSATTVADNTPIPSDDNIEMGEVGELPDVTEEDNTATLS
jgi:hypothetical protein